MVIVVPVNFSDDNLDGTVCYCIDDSSEVIRSVRYYEGKPMLELITLVILNGRRRDDFEVAIDLEEEISHLEVREQTSKEFCCLDFLILGLILLLNEYRTN